jgi:hypothetical protein
MTTEATTQHEDQHALDVSAQPVSRSSPASPAGQIARLRPAVQSRWPARIFRVGEVVVPEKRKPFASTRRWVARALLARAGSRDRDRVPVNRAVRCQAAGLCTR